MRIDHLLVFLVVAVVTGCSGNQRKEVTIEGTVTVEGKIVDGGTIQFVPVNQEGSFEGGGMILKGKFTATVPYGEMLVRFRGVEYEQKDADGNPLGGSSGVDASGMAFVIEPPARRLIPDRYWFDSDVTVTVESAKQQFNFDLKAQ